MLKFWLYRPLGLGFSELRVKFTATLVVWTESNNRETDGPFVEEGQQCFWGHSDRCMVRDRALQSLPGCLLVVLVANLLTCQ